ncbi:Hypothetical predicted protein, partial [Pelobates cultripes]
DLRLQIRKLLSDDIAWQMTQSQRYFYDWANRIDAPLAKCLKPRLHIKPIATIRTSTGSLVSSLDEIYKKFWKYFSKLYDHTPDHHDEDLEKDTVMDNFEGSLNLSKIPSDLVDSLDAKISLQEIKIAIPSLLPYVQEVFHLARQT